MNVELVATPATGLESIAAQEVRDLGYKVEVENGKVIFERNSSAIARSNLWLRVADRVKLVVGEFKAYTSDELFEKTKDLPWEKYIDENGQFPVSGKSHKSKLSIVRDCQAIVKKSMAERRKSKHRVAGNMTEKGRLNRGEASNAKDKVT